MESQTISGRSSNWIKLKLNLKRWIFFQKNEEKVSTKGESMRERKREREREREGEAVLTVSQSVNFTLVLVLYCRRQI